MIDTGRLTMNYITKLTENDKKELEIIWKKHANAQVRMRAHAILLSHSGMTQLELIKVFNVCRQTASRWLRAFHLSGLDSLYDKPRSGRPRNVLSRKRQPI